MQNDLETIVLMDEEGNDVEFRVVTKLDIEENEYFILSPSDDDEVVVAMKVVEDEEGNEGLVPVDNDFEIEMIEEAYSTIMSEE